MSRSKHWLAKQKFELLLPCVNSAKVQLVNVLQTVQNELVEVLSDLAAADVEPTFASHVVAPREHVST